FSTYTSGQVYFLFDQETAFPIDRIRTTAFQQTSLPKFGQRYGYTDINDYDVLILPGGRRLDQLFWQEQRREILAWLERGGTIIALESAAEFFTKSGKFGNLNLVKSPQDTSDTAKYLQYGDRETYRGLRRIPGSALRGEVDVTHPLAFGVKPEVYPLKLTTAALEPSTRLESVGTYHRQGTELLTAGYASTENLNRLAGKTFAGVQRFGDGAVVYLVDNPHYRMFWRSTSRMVQNAAFIVPNF
ncbi:MAG: peptidase M14, partial [Bacteroidota bacterium]